MAAISIHFYGRLAEQAGQELSFEVPEDGLAIRDLRAQLAERFGPDLLDPRVRAAVGDVIVGDDRTIRPGEQVDILAPLSGG